MPATLDSDRRATESADERRGFGNEKCLWRIFMAVRIFVARVNFLDYLGCQVTGFLSAW